MYKIYIFLLFQIFCCLGCVDGKHIHEFVAFCILCLWNSCRQDWKKKDFLYCSVYEWWRNFHQFIHAWIHIFHNHTIHYWFWWVIQEHTVRRWIFKNIDNDRYLLGAMGVFAIPFTLNVELVGLKYKTIVGLLFQVPFAIGEILIGLCAMYVRDYRWFQTALAIPHAVMLLLFFIIPESPRWLIQKKKYKEARKVIESAAKFNKVRSLKMSKIHFILSY